MRRPLFGDGFPRKAPEVATPVNIGNADNLLSVIDTRSSEWAAASPRFMALTLYAYFENSSADLVVSLYSQQGDTLQFLTSYKQPTEAQAGLSGPAPVKILDAYLLRGPTRILACVEEDGGTSNVLLYGYFELEPAQTPDPRELRALQASPNPSSPYYAGVASISSGKDQIVHLLEAGQLDEITLDYAPATDGEEFSATPKMAIGETLQFFLNPMVSDEGSAYVRLFDGIPLMPPGSSLAQRALRVVTTEVNSAHVIGSFKR